MVDGSLCCFHLHVESRMELFSLRTKWTARHEMLTKSAFHFVVLYHLGVWQHVCDPGSSIYDLSGSGRGTYSFSNLKFKQTKWRRWCTLSNIFCYFLLFFLFSFCHVTSSGFFFLSAKLCSRKCTRRFSSFSFVFRVWRIDRRSLGFYQEKNGYYFVSFRVNQFHCIRGIWHASDQTVRDFCWHVHFATQQSLNSRKTGRHLQCIYNWK